MSISNLRISSNINQLQMRDIFTPSCNYLDHGQLNIIRGVNSRPTSNDATKLFNRYNVVTVQSTMMMLKIKIFLSASDLHIDSKPITSPMIV